MRCNSLLVFALSGTVLFALSGTCVEETHTVCVLTNKRPPFPSSLRLRCMLLRGGDKNGCITEANSRHISTVQQKPVENWIEEDVIEFFRGLNVTIGPKIEEYLERLK
jgi:hypothetical protein